MKVLHVITGLGVGGAELQLRAVLRQTRHDADVVTLYNPGPVADMIRADGTAVRTLGMRSNTQLSSLLRLLRIIRAGRYDVVHTHLYRSQGARRVVRRPGWQSTLGSFSAPSTRSAKRTWSAAGCPRRCRRCTWRPSCSQT